MPSRSWLIIPGLQALAIGAFVAVPDGSWAQFLWQLAVGWTGAVCAFVGARRARGAAAAVWWLLGAGIFFNASGVLVDCIRRLVFHRTDMPNVADIAFLALYPCVLAGLGLIVFRRSAGAPWAELATGTLSSAVLTIGGGLVLWELVIWNREVDHNISFIDRAIASAYPIADLMVLGFILRLILGGARNRAFRLMLLSLCCFLAADVGWAVVFKSGPNPSPLTRHLLMMMSMCAFAIMGLAALHPSAPTVAPRRAGPRDDDAASWNALALSLASAPAVLLIEALLDQMFAGRH